MDAARIQLMLLALVIAGSVLLCSGCGSTSNEEAATDARPSPNGVNSPQGDAIPPPDAASDDQRAAGGSRTRGLIVDVAGAVREPGVYQMPVGARVHEAIEAAGGLRSGADVSALNRAAPVVDGQQVLVPARASAGAGVGVGAAPGSGTGTGAGAGTSSVAPGAKVSINTADIAALDTLPGVGPVTAERIVAEREQGGPFASIDDLDRVSGIGPATIESLREVVTT